MSRQTTVRESLIRKIKLMIHFRIEFIIIPSSTLRPKPGKTKVVVIDTILPYPYATASMKVKLLCTCTNGKIYSWLAVLKSLRPSVTRADMVFSPSRTQTRGSKYLSWLLESRLMTILGGSEEYRETTYFLFGLSSPSGLPTCCMR